LLLALSLPTFEYICSLHYGARGPNRTLGAKMSVELRLSNHSIQITCSLNIGLKSPKHINETTFDWANTYLIHNNTRHSAYTLTNGSLSQPFSLLKLHLISEMREHSRKAHICTQGKHMSHNHTVLLDDYMKCKTQVATYGRRTFALIPST